MNAIRKQEMLDNTDNAFMFYKDAHKSHVNNMTVNNHLIFPLPKCTGSGSA